jgi:hypothetical protein
VEDQFKDVHSMMTLPNCNFAATAILVNLISGISTIFYDQHGGSGARFEGALRDFYPWDLQPSNNATPETVIDCLYDTVRNPLAHSLAVQTHEIKAKSGPTEACDRQKTVRQEFRLPASQVYQKTSWKESNIRTHRRGRR